MALLDNSERYGCLSKLLHWGIALLLLWQFASAGAHLFLEDSVVDEFLWATHKPLGFLLLLLIVVRIGWALANCARRPKAVNLAAKLGHIALYAVMLAVPVLALARQYGSGRAFEPFGLPLMAGFEGKIEWLMAPGNMLHGALGWTLLALIAGHIMMAIWHKKQAGGAQVFARMWR